MVRLFTALPKFTTDHSPESGKNVDLTDDIRDRSGEETNHETDEDTILTEKDPESQLV